MGVASNKSWHVVDLSKGGEDVGRWCLLVLAERTPGIWVDFWLLDVCGVEEDGQLVLQRKDSSQHPDPIPNEELGDRHPERLVELVDDIAQGYFKWDGCAHLSLHGHTCSKEQWDSLGSHIRLARAVSTAVFGVPRTEEGG